MIKMIFLSNLTESTYNPQFLTLKLCLWVARKIEESRFSDETFTVVQVMLCSFTQKKVPWENMYQILLWIALKFKQIFTKDVGFISICNQIFVGERNLTHQFRLTTTELIITYASMKHFIFDDLIDTIFNVLMVLLRSFWQARAHVCRLAHSRFQKLLKLIQKLLMTFLLLPNIQDSIWLDL